jgi:hypothetical protein
MSNSKPPSLYSRIRTHGTLAESPRNVFGRSILVLGESMFVFVSNKLGIFGSIAVTLVLSFVLVKACTLM